MTSDRRTDYGDMASEAMVLAGRIRPLLARQDPGIVGAVLVDLLASFIAGHHPETRAEQLEMFVEHVEKIIPVEVERMIAHGLCGPEWRGATARQWGEQ